MKKYIKLMRVHHYIKNLLVFVALICSGCLFDFEKFSKCIMGFLAFCTISSVVYIINDIKDVAKDRAHPTKCKRPIASGEVTNNQALLLAVILSMLALFFNYFTYSFESLFLLVLYFAMNIAYSLGLKNYTIIDIAILVSGFLIRIIYGSVITGIDISNWLYLTVVVFALYFALGKRRNEIKQLGTDSTRNVLKKYPILFLDKSMNMCLTLGNAFYSLWSMDEKTIGLYNNDKVVFTAPLILLITLKYSLDVEGSSDGDPVEVLLSDSVLMLMTIAYILIMLSILYF